MFDYLLSLFVRFAAGTILLGWTLSATGLLNGRGYLVFGIPLALLILYFSRLKAYKVGTFVSLRRLIIWWCRRRWLPLIFVATFGLVILGSILHQPNNFDGLSYRIPKVLEWLGEFKWHWLHSPFAPINHTLPNYEWLTVPLYLSTGSFHSTVSLNWLAYLLLPPLVFRLLTAAGVAQRLAWNWMWIFPSGYLFVLQAGGIGNDLLGLTLLLASLHCATRYTDRGNKCYLLDALLAAGVCTGIKLSNAPLGLFGLIILCGNWRRLWADGRVVMIGSLAAAFVSVLVPMTLNWLHSGSILGTTGGEDQVTHPAAGWVGNGLFTILTLLSPPFLPEANQIGGSLEQALGNPLLSWMHAHYEKFTLRLNELPQEESGVLGLGMMILLFACCSARKPRPPRIAPALPLHWQRLAWPVWLGFSLLVLFGKLGTGAAFPRNMMAWMPLPLAMVLARNGTTRILRTRFWKIAAPIVMLSAWPVLLVTPSRPLIPPSALAAVAKHTGLSPTICARLQIVYETYALRSDPFAVLRQSIPPNSSVLGLLTDGAEPTAAWWLPYGARRCIFIFSEADVVAARRAGIRCVIIKEEACQKYFGMNSDQWLTTHDARLIKAGEVPIFASQPPKHYVVTEFKADVERPNVE